MAFFKFRWPGQSEDGEQPSSRRVSRTAQTESIESLRRRARHRLIGAAVLVGVGVLGFPLLFDTQPRPIPVDVPIEIPDRNQVAPMVVPSNGATQGSAQVATAPAVGTESSLDRGEEVVPAVPPPPPAPVAAPVPAVVAPIPVPIPPVPTPAVVEPKPAPKPEVKAEPKPEVKKPEPRIEVKPKPEPKPEPKKPAQDDDAARARALLEGRSPANPPAAATPAAKQDGRFVVQVGAFADAEKAKEVRQRLQGAGLSAFTQEVNTSAGKRIRVRVGPFNGRADADKAAARIKGLGLPAAVQPG